MIDIIEKDGIFGLKLRILDLYSESICIYPGVLQY